MKKGMALFLAMLMLLSCVSCSETGPSGSDAESTPANDTVTPVEESVPEETETEEPDRFDGVDFNGRTFRISTSVDTYDATNGDQFIRGSGETNGESVNDAVYERNQKVSDKLGVALEFTETNYNYGDAQTQIKNLILSGVDAYDIIVNDLRALAGLSVEGNLHTVANTDILDLSQSWWYEDAMRDLEIVDGGLYCLIGDYFTDSLASCHTLYVNESMLADVNEGDGEYINNLVFDGSWTYDAMMEVMALAMEDSDGSGAMNEGDRFGFTCIGTWGSAIPFLIGTGIEFISTENGTIEYAFNNERSVQILEKMNELFWNDATITNISNWSAEGLRVNFANSKTLIMGYNRLGDLANLRDIDFSVGIVPYPKLDVEQENYVTSMHDITEIGAIPVTVPVADLDFVFTCLEVLSMETAKTVIPEYYENGLKLKYVEGQEDSKMIDLIHDSIGSPFAVAFNTTLGDFMLGVCFCTPLGNGSTDFASAYKKNQKKSVKDLKKLMENATAAVENAKAALGEE